jgi:cytochrome c6
MKRSVLSLFALALIMALALATSTPAMADDTAALYKSKCQICHGPDGKGSAAGEKMGVKDFHTSKSTDAQMFDIVKKGKNKMPSFDKKLTDDQIKDLIKYIHTLK